MDLKKLVKKINKKYWKNGQRLTLNTDCYLVSESGPAAYISVWFCKDNWLEKDSIYLFDILCDRAFFDMTLYPTYKSKKYNIIDYIDYQAISITPYYMEQVFYLRDKKEITENDIINCAKYFCDNVLEDCGVWNYKFIKKELDKEEKE